MPKIYLSYRPTDSVPDALVDRIAAICAECGFDEVLAGGENLAEIEAAIRTVDAVLVLIGEKWQALLDEQRGNPGDLVQQEIGLCLESRKLLVPLLLGGKVPAVDALPERVKAFYLCLGNPVEPAALEEQLPAVLRPLLTASAERLGAAASAKQEERRLAQEEVKKQEDHVRAQEIRERSKYFSPGPIFAPGTLPFRAQPAKAGPASTAAPAPAAPVAAPALPVPVAVPPASAAPAAAPNPSTPVAVPSSSVPPPAVPVSVQPKPPALPTPARQAGNDSIPSNDAPPASKQSKGCFGSALLLLVLVIAAGVLGVFQPWNRLLVSNAGGMTPGKPAMGPGFTGPGQ